MTPGPSIIRRCAECGKQIREFTAASGNAIDVRRWTDGKTVYPMWPTRLRLVLCPHCCGVLWLDEQEFVGELVPWATPGMSAVYNEALSCLDPAFDDYLTAIGRADTDRGKERYLRLHAWWAGNDVRRNGDATTPLSASETTNLNALVKLLDEADDYERLVKAEAIRELGQFEDALVHLSHPFPSELLDKVRSISLLAKQRKSMVEEVKTNDRGMLGSTIFIANRGGTPR